MSSLARYSRQMLFKKIKQPGQERLLRSRIAIVGLGALGCVSANETARTGIGYIRLIDDDIVEQSNLQRQVLYTDEDARLGRLKAETAAERLRDANPDINILPVTERLTAENADRLLGGVDLVIDATDNLPTRFLINEYCVKHRIPWVYGGAVESEGMTADFLPDGPCLSCMLGITHLTEGGPAPRTAGTVGVLNMLTAIVASVQAAEAVKILLNSPDVRNSLLFFDIWENEFQQIPVEKNPDCPVCGRHEYHYLQK